jgi:multidrug efflux pump subunit AcrA (membrane-fusion protein)
MNLINQQSIQNKFFNASVVFRFILAVFLSSCSHTAGKYSVMKGAFRQSITETGNLEAVQSVIINMPSLNYQYGYQYKIIGLAEHGKMVKKGDSLVALDPSSVYKVIISKEESLENELATAKKQRVQMENNIQDLQAQYKNELAAYELKKLEMDRMQFESESKRRIKEFEFLQSQMRLEKIRRNLELRPKLEQLDLEIQEIKVRQRQAEIADAKSVLDKLIIYSPGEGIFQVNKSRTSTGDQFIRVGDNMSIGRSIAKLPDIRKMKALSGIHEADISKVREGFPVIVRLDALPNVEFKGKVTKISRVCIGAEGKKTFSTEITIDDTDLRLKPGMTVSCEYICYESDDALYVPNHCVLREGNKAYLLLSRGNSLKKTEIEVLASNSLYTAISGEVKAGQGISEATGATILAQ